MIFTATERRTLCLALRMAIDAEQDRADAYGGDPGLGGVLDADEKASIRACEQNIRRFNALLDRLEAKP
jgi:hypothetical protein